MKRTLSVVSVVPLAVALLLAMGGATTASAATAGATTATTTSSTSSTVKARAPHQQDYPDFSCNYRYNKNESDNQYWCSYPYYYHHQWHQYHWWDADYNPPNWSSSSSQDYPDFSCNYRYNKNESDNQYWCSYRYYYHHQWHQYHWWDADYNPPNWS